ncbi:MAG: hypothetical protein ACTHMO_02510 [Rhodanobacteraceae bacterium]
MSLRHAVCLLQILLGVAIGFPHPAAAQKSTTEAELAASSGSADAIDVSAMLQSASQHKLELTSGEIEQLATAGQVDTERVEELTRRCNDGNFVDHTSGLVWGDAVQGCGLVGDWAAKSLGLNSAKVELAYQRACALPRAQGLNKVATELSIESEFGNYCAVLGDLYRQRGDVRRALAIFQRAPNCHASGFEPAYPNLYDTACTLAADQILEANATNVIKLCTQTSQNCSVEDVERAKQNGLKVEADFHQLCTRPFSGGAPPICDTHLNKQEQEAAERYWQKASELAHERAEQEYEQRMATERAHDANVNALVSAVRSLPSGDDPNAIIDTANQQAANMIALGAANDAARARMAAGAAQMSSRLASSSPTARGSTPEPAANTGAASGSAQPASATNQPTPSGATASQADGSDNSDSGQFTSPMSPNCVRMFNDSSMYGWVALQNTCSQKMTVTFEAKNGNFGGTMDLAPGGSDSTGRSPDEINAGGGIDWYPCEYGYIPTNMNGHDAVTTPVTEYTCKSRGY